MSNDKLVERRFQDYIVEQLAAEGWLVGESAHYDCERALYPEDLIAFVQEARPEQWEKFSRIYSRDPEKHLLDAAVRHLEKHGTLWLLRNPLADRGAKIELCSFQPDHSINPDTLARYAANRLRVVPELKYSPHGYDGRIDLALFVNGLPVVTIELKSSYKQGLDNAKKQYCLDRNPKTNSRAEPLLTFKRGALVHFAASQFEVAMTTRLDGMKTFFLPFNRGRRDGSAGNDTPPKGYATAYLWEEILQRDNFLHILARYLHLERKEKSSPLGELEVKETMIFPRYHQWDVVQSLIQSVRREGSGGKYLVQHSAGSGKSNSIAWLSHQLSALHDESGDKLFNSIIVITDRNVLDSQLQDTIYQFEHKQGVIARINREEGEGSKSAKLVEALSSGTSIIIVTIQTFPYVLDAIREQSGLAGRKFAVIADEAHSSQSGSTARKLREVLMAEELADKEELSAEDMMNATLAARAGSGNISYFAFTATPKAKTLELFGQRPRPEEPASKDNKPEPFHSYTMRQAIEEGFILDVLQNYTSYGVAYKLAQQAAEGDREVDGKKARLKLSRWVRLHPHNIAQKTQVVVEHFHEHIASLLAGQAKAMLVTSSRLEAVRYKRAVDKYVKEKGYDNVSAMVAFSGEVKDKEYSNEAFTENSMNPGLQGRDMRKAFDTDDYQLMIVANKFQTGFDQPKLVCMYVDKKLNGVDCVQTLSRLNRTYPGKDVTFVLDFVNDPQDILDAFQPYYESTALANVSDPNLVYDLLHKLRDNQIFNWHEVLGCADAYFDPKRDADAIGPYVTPGRDRYAKRFRHAADALRTAKKQLKRIEAGHNDVEIKNAQRSVTEAEEALDTLRVFRKDLQSFTRYYEFASQIVPFDDRDLESLNVYARALLPLLREERLDDEVLDLSDVQMSHYRLWEKRTQDLKLLEDSEEYGLEGVTGLGGATPKDQKKDLLSEILEQLNDLFGAETTEKDKLNWVRGLADKVSEHEGVMAQIRNNSEEQAMIGDFPSAVSSAAIEQMNNNNSLSTRYLDDAVVAREINRMIYRLLTQVGSQSAE